MIKKFNIGNSITIEYNDLSEANIVELKEMTLKEVVEDELE